MNNTRFATAIHIMTLLAEHPDQWMSSDLIAGSININAVVVRKEIGVLRDAGLLESRMGKEGGCRLSMKPKEIKISRIYSAVRNSDVLGKKNLHPNVKCKVGKGINRNLDALNREADGAIVQFLGQKTLAGFLSQFK